MKPITHRSILMAFVNEPRVNVLTSNNNIATNMTTHILFAGDIELSIILIDVICNW